MHNFYREKNTHVKINSNVHSDYLSLKTTVDPIILNLSECDISVNFCHKYSPQNVEKTFVKREIY